MIQPRTSSEIGQIVSSAKVGVSNYCWSNFATLPVALEAVSISILRVYAEARASGAPDTVEGYYVRHWIV